MKPGSRVERFARGLPVRVVQSVRSASAAKVQSRLDAGRAYFGEGLDAARSQAAAIKDEVLDRLDEWVERFEQAAAANGMIVHRAADAEAARAIIVGLIKDRAGPGAGIVKAKSMATEEIHLNAALEEEGYHPLETDLGEFIVQLDGDTPSHIVTPIIHKNRFEVAATMAREGIGPYSEEPETLTMQAREHLREAFRTAAIGISGGNFLVAESGRIVLVENEGNNRLSTTAPDVHIALVGIEKLVPRDADLPLFLRLLGLSATGQQLTTYTHFIHGPRREDEPDGPKEVHVVLLDNGRRRVAAGPYRSILRCIRCGACLNVCPVYRSASGHGYEHVYSGPVGAVLAPALEGVEKLGDLAKASTLCGACEEVCPVKIPIPDLLLKLRDEAERKGSPEEFGKLDWTWFGQAATDAKKWRTGLKLLPLAKLAPLGGWGESHATPEREGRDFRMWWAQHQPNVEILRDRAPVSPARFAEAKPELGLRAQFEARFLAHGGELIDRSELETLLEQGWIGDVDAAEALGMEPTSDDVWSASVGVTCVAAILAETGSVLLHAAPGRRRLSSLAPEIHLVLLHPCQLVTGLDEAVAKLGGRTSVIVTGPSRTADIEGVLVRGIHGPKRLLAVWLD